MEDKAVQNIAIEKLKCRRQVRTRFDEESLIGKAQTIKETGMLQPILVRREGGDLVVLDGQRRLMAATIAKLTHVPVIIDDRELSEFEVVLRQLIVNGSRKDLDPLDEARGIHKLIELTKWPAAQVAVKLGRSPSMVSKLLALLNLPESVQEKIASGSLPLTTAYALFKAADSENQHELANEAANGGLTRDQVVSRAKSRQVKAAEKPSRKKSPGERVSIPLGGGRSVAVSGPSLSIASVIEWLADVLEKLRGVEDKNIEMSEAVKLISSHS